ncbi:hypothetical protein [Methanosarcina sp.]|uniref:hypothetical protein n=1 Tax=Methanosarcina sp. TaxID=2213 RepID=UPI003C74F342
MGPELSLRIYTGNVQAIIDPCLSASNSTTRAEQVDDTLYQESISWHSLESVRFKALMGQVAFAWSSLDNNLSR